TLPVGDAGERVERVTDPPQIVHLPVHGETFLDSRADARIPPFVRLEEGVGKHSTVAELPGNGERFLVQLAAYRGVAPLGGEGTGLGERLRPQRVALGRRWQGEELVEPVAALGRAAPEPPV